jgi:ankyrin repeat protein
MAHSMRTGGSLIRANPLKFVLSLLVLATPMATLADLTLHDACKNDDLALANRLIDQGSSPNDATQAFMPLHSCAKHDSIRVATLLIDKGAKVDALDSGLESPLHWAAEWGGSQVAHLLLEKGADVHRVDQDGNSPLLKTWGIIYHIGFYNMERAVSLYEALIGDLFKHGASVNERDPKGNTALFSVSGERDSRPASYLISQGIDINARAVDGSTALMGSAFSSPSIATTRVLLEHGADVNLADHSGSTALLVSMGRGNTETTRLLLAYGADPAAKDAGGNALLYAVNFGEWELAQLFVDRGFDVNTVDRRGNNALMVTVGKSRGNPEFDDLIDSLISHGTYLDTQNKGGWCALHGASFKVSQKLLEHGASPNLQGDNGDTPLLELLKQTRIGPPLSEDQRATVTLLIGRANLDLQDHDGYTTVAVMAEGSDPEIDLLIAKQLATHGADLNIKTAKGITPTWLAFNRHFDQMVLLLLDQGADTDARDSNRATLLIRTESPELVRSLLAHHADPNAQDRWGNAPLHFAAGSGNVENAKALLAAGANINVRDNERNTPLHYAESEAMIELLRSHGGIK